MNEVSKDVEIQGKKYRVGRVTALVGNWISIKISSCSEQEFMKIQQYLLAVCSEYNGAEVPMPVMMTDGRWANKDLEYDLPAVGLLFQESLDFNIRPFLNALASKDSSAQAGAQVTKP
jgi:hypothetical protein